MAELFLQDLAQVFLCDGKVGRVITCMSDWFCMLRVQVHVGGIWCLVDAKLSLADNKVTVNRTATNIHIPKLSTVPQKVWMSFLATNSGVH